MAIEFPATFYENYSYMIMIEIEPGIITIMPPNQCDWVFNLKKVDDQKWTVYGYKDDVFSDCGPQEQNSIYELVDNNWECTSFTEEYLLMSKD